jgi:hypothetical protein
VRRLSLALAAAVLVLVIAGAAFPAGSAETWQWQAAADQGALAMTTSGPDQITLSVQAATTELPALVVGVNGRAVQEASSSSLEGAAPLATFSVIDSAGSRAVLGVAQSNVAHVYLDVDGASARELPLSSLGAFAVGDLPAGASIELQAVAADGSALGRSTIPAASASCSASAAACTSQSLAATGSTIAYAVVESRSRGFSHDRLTRIDPASLNPVGRSLLLGSRSVPPIVGAVALSPDQKRLAFAHTHGGTISIVDLASMRVAETIQTRAGIDVRSLAWLDDNELALIGQRMSKPYAREVTGRWLIRVHVDTRVSVDLSLPKKATLEYSQRAGSRLISVLRPNSFRDPTRTVAVSDADGQTSIFPVALPVPSPTLFEDRPIASADGTHLYIVRAGGQVIDVDLATHKWVVHRITAPGDAPSTVPVASALLADATPNGLVVYGFFTVERGGHPVFRSGIYRIDTASWSATTLDPIASDFLVYGDKIAMFGRASLPFPTRKNAPATGIEVVSAASGQRAFHLFGARAFSGVVVIGRFGHALRQQTLPGVPYGFLDRRFDAASGASTGSARPPLSALRLIYRGSQAIGESGAAATPTPTRASSAAPAALPRAFARPATPLDALPAKAPFRSGLPGRGGTHEEIIAARRIASYTDGRGRRSLLYLLRSAHEICEFTVRGSGAGGGCSPAADFFAGRHVVAGSGRLVTGVADDDVATLVIVGTLGVRHRVRLTDDGGFIYDCKAYNGCTCVVDHVEAFDSSGQKIESDRVGGACRKKRNAARTTQSLRASGAFTISNRGRPVAVHGTLGFFRLRRPYHVFLLGSAGARSFYRVQVAPHFTCWGSGPKQTTGKVGELGCPNLVGAYPLQLEDTVVELRRGDKTPHFLRLDGIVADQAVAVGLQDEHGKIVEQVGVTDNLYSFAPPYPSGMLRVVPLDAQGKPLVARVAQGTNQTAPRGMFGPRAGKTTAGQLRHVVQRGQARGVSVEVGANSVVVFDLHGIDPAISAALGGRSASFSCFQVNGQNIRHNRRAGISAPLGPSVALRISGIAPQYDGCEIGGSYGHRWPDRFGSHSILEVALTPQGDRYFEDRATARDLAAFVRSAKTQSIRRKLGSALRAAMRATYGNQVALLGSASASAPPGRIGIWTQGGRTTFSERSHLGDRLYVEFDGGKLVRENVRGLAFVF